MFCRRRREVEEFTPVIEKSKTIPDLAMSPRKLVDRYMRGQLDGLERQAIYEPYYTIDSPNPVRKPDADLIDLYEHGQLLRDTYADMVKRAKALLKSSKTSAQQTAPQVEGVDG